MPHGRWHLDEMLVRIGGKQMYLSRAVDAEGEVLDVLLQAKRDRRAAQKLMRKLLKRQGMAPDEWVTDKNPAYGAALHELKLTRDPFTPRPSGPTTARRVRTCRCDDESGSCRFKSPGSAQRFLQCMQRSTTRSPFLAISSLERLGSSEPKRSPPGAKLRV